MWLLWNGDEAGCFPKCRDLPQLESQVEDMLQRLSQFLSACFEKSWTDSIRAGYFPGAQSSQLSCDLTPVMGGGGLCVVAWGRGTAVESVRRLEARGSGATQIVVGAGSEQV